MNNNFILNEVKSRLFIGVFGVIFVRIFDTFAPLILMYIFGSEYLSHSIIKHVLCSICFILILVIFYSIIFKYKFFSLNVFSIFSLIFISVLSLGWIAMDIIFDYTNIFSNLIMIEEHLLHNTVLRDYTKQVFNSIYYFVYFITAFLIFNIYAQRLNLLKKTGMFSILQKDGVNFMISNLFNKENKYVLLLKAIRIDLNLNITEFAKLLNVSSSEVSMWESNKREVDRDIQIYLAKQIQNRLVKEI
jgi:DNA-binding transcriptional regulator YiaG